MSDEPLQDDDPLLRSLRDLPVHDAPKAPAARAAFVGAFQPLHLRLALGLGRAAVPVALASIVGLYLTWAFSAAIALAN